MELQDYIEEIKLEVTGGLLELEIPDETLALVVKKSLREVQRFIDETRLITVPFSSCIDLSSAKDKNGKEIKTVSSVVNVYRTQGYTGDMNSGPITSDTDPVFAQMYLAFGSGGTMYNLNDYVLNYLAYNTMLQMKNTTSTDLKFHEDKSENKLYINTAYDKPDYITIEYIPVLNDVNDIKDPYWTDILIRLSVAQTKQVLGRIRSRYTQSNALWTQDGETMLAEGNAELTDLREKLRVNAQLCYPID